MSSKIKLCAFADEASPMLNEQIEALIENDISLLEIRVVNNKNISKITTDESKEIKKQLDASGISVWAIGSPAGKIKLNDDFNTELDQFKQMLDCGAILNAKCMRLFSFYETSSKQEHFESVCEKLTKYVELCKSYNIIPCHENEKGIYGEDAKHCYDILKTVPGLKAVFDPANFVQAKQDTLEAWNLLEEYVYYGHIKDALANGSIVPPGDGIGHIPEYLPKFVKKGCSVLTIEPHLHKFVGLDSLEKDGSKSNIGSVKFNNNREAFSYAATALKKIISDLGI